MKSFFYTAFILFLFSLNLYAKDLNLSVPDNAMVESGQDVSLFDLCGLQDNSGYNFLKNISVVSQLKPGEKTYLYRTSLVESLKKYSFTDFNLYMSNRVRIEAKSYEFTDDIAQNLLTAYLHEKKYNGFKIVKLTLVGNRLFAKKDFDMVDVRFWQEDLHPGLNRGEFTIYQKGLEANVKFIVKFEQTVSMVCAAKDLLKGDIITSDMLTLKSIVLERDKGHFFTDTKFLLGKKLRKNYNKDEIITAAMIYVPSLINRGEDVQIVALSENITVITNGEARKKGHLGDIIPVLNKRSGKEVYGEIISSNSVRVTF